MGSGKESGRDERGATAWEAHQGYELDDLLRAARRVAADDLAPHAERVDRERRFPDEAFAALAGAGLLGLMVPVAYGGLGAGPTQLVQVGEILAEACASTGLCFLMHCCGCAAIAATTSEAQGRRYLEPLARGDFLASIAFTGPRDAVVESAVQDDLGSARLSLRRPFVTGGDRVDLVLVLAEENLYVVETDRAGVRFEGRWEGLGMSGSNTTTLVLDNVLVSETNRIGAPRGGAALRHEVVRPLFLLGLAAVNLGIARAALAVAVGQARIRRSADDLFPGGAFAIHERLAEMQSRLDAAASVTHAAASETHGATSTAPLRGMEAKVLACEAAIDITQKALDLCGGRGYSRHLPVERHLRDARAGALMTPTIDELKSAIGRIVLNDE